MNTTRKIISSFLAVTMLFPAFAGTVSFARDTSEKSIKNDYMSFSVNGENGFFDIATLEGHPQKSQDNDMPLLYDGDSIQTSFTTVRVDGKDYIFGQDYGLFNINAKIGTTTVDAVNNSISTEWSINGIKVTQTAYLSRTDNTVTTGNVGLSYTVENTTDKAHDVGIRVMLDNSLGEIDAPIVMAQNEIAPISKETEFFGNNRDPGAYIRFLDNGDMPSKEAYILFDTPMVNMPDDVIVGHWNNLASYKWTYAPDNDLSFSTGFNSYGTADTATALYWNEQKLSAGETYSKSMLYGVGDFSVGGLSGNFNISMEIDDDGLILDGDKYVDNTVDARITIYNNLDGSVDLNSATLNLSCDDGAFFVYEQTDDEIIGMQSFTENVGFIAAGSVETYDCEILVNVPEELKAIKVSAELVGNAEGDTSTASQYIIAPSPKMVNPAFAVTDIADDTFHISGTRVFVLSGIFDVDLLSDRSKWTMALVSTTDPNLRYEVNSSNATLTSENAMSVVYDGNMVIGEYTIEFSFFEDYATFFGNTYEGPKIHIVNDESLIMPKYSLLGVVRYGTDYNSEYKIITFASEEELASNTASINATTVNEVLLVLRGEFQVDYGENGEVLGYTALSDFSVNDVATGLSSSRLEYFSSAGGGVRLTGVDAVYSAAKGTQILGCDWKIELNNGVKHSLSSENVKLESTGLTNVILNIAGGLINLKFGVFGKHDGNYVISYGGTLSLMGYDVASEQEITVTESLTGRNYKGLYASCDITDVMFDKDGFVGIDTTTKIALVATNVLGCAQADAFALELMINTIDDEYSGSLDVTILKKLIFTLGFGLAPATLEDGESVIMFDSFVGNFAVPPAQAVPLVPGIFGIYMIGINISGIAELVDLSMGTPMEVRQSANQLTTNVTVSLGFTLFELVNIVGSASVGTNHLYFTGTGGVIAVPACSMTMALKVGWKQAIYDSVSGTRLSPSAGNVSVSSDVNILGIIKCGASGSYSYVDYANAARWDKNTVVLNLYGAVYMPEGVPIIGGTELLGATGTIGSKGVDVSVVILNNEVGLSYGWGNEEVTWLFDYDENSSKDDAKVGLNNMKYLAVSTPDVKLMSDENYISGSFGIEEEYSALIGIDYYGDTPNISDLCLKIDGNEFELKEADENYSNGNCVIVPDTGEGGKIIIGTAEPPVGTHTYTLYSKSAAKMMNMNALGFKKSAKAVKTIHNADGSVTVKADGNLDGSTVSLYYVSDKEMYDNIKTEEYTDENGESKIRVYKEVNGEKTELDTEFYEKFKEHQFASTTVDQNVSEITLTPKFDAQIHSGNYYTMAVIRSPYGNISRCITDDTMEYTNAIEPKSVESVSITDIGDESIQVNVTDATDTDYTGYFVSIFNETDNEYTVESRYCKKGEEIKINSVAQANKKYHAEVTSVNVVSESEFAESADTVTSNTIELHAPQKANISLALNNSTVDGTYVDVNNNEIAVPYITDDIGKFSVTSDIPVTGSYVLDDIETSLGDSPQTSFDFSISDLNSGIHSLYFKGVSEQGDTAKSDAVSFAISTGAPSVVLEESAVIIDDGKITVRGKASSAQKVVFMDKEYPVSNDGSFEICENVNIDRFAQAYKLKAIGYDMQETTVSLFAINTDTKPIESIVLKADGNDAETVTLKTGDKLQLSAVGTADGVERDMGDNIEIKVYNGNNLVTLDSNNTLTALSPGTAYVKAIYSLGKRTDGTSTKNYTFEDMLEINILNQLSTPVASVPNGATITTSKKLTLSGDGDIYYTLDGSEPTVQSLKYTEPITLPTGEVTLKAKSIKNGCLDSEVLTVTYNVTKSSSSSGNGGSTTFVSSTPASDLTITVSTADRTVDYGYPLGLSSENGTIYYTTDGTTPNKYSTKYTEPIVIDRNMTVRAVVCDENDVYSDVYEYSFNINGYDIYLKEDTQKNSLITGYPDKTFCPDNAITRAEAAAVLRRASEMYGYYVDENSFTDVDMWAKDYINELAAAGIVTGYPDATFRPNNQVTRAEFVAMLMRIIGVEGTGSVYTDTDNHWAKAYIAKACEYGYINGYDDNTFRPDYPITRAEVMAVMSRVFNFGSDGETTEFIDVTPEHWAFGYIAD